MGSNFSHFIGRTPAPDVGGGSRVFNDPFEHIADIAGFKIRGIRAYGRCPVCSYGTRGNHNASMMQADNGGILYRCYKDCTFEQFKEWLDSQGYKGEYRTAPLSDAKIAERKAKQAEHDRKTREKVAKIRSECREIIEGDHVWQFFKKRGLSDEAIREVMRVGDVMAHNWLYWGFDDEFGALGAHRSFSAYVALIRRPDGNVAIHRIYTDGEGNKAPVKSPRLALGRQDGGLVMLGNRSGGVICIAEGIESAMALMSGIAPDYGTVFSAVSAANMAIAQPPISPDDPRPVRIYSDPEPKGIDAARALAGRLKARGHNVEVIIPPEGMDWNDLLLAAKAELGESAA